MKTIIFTLFSFFGLYSSSFSQFLVKEGVIQELYDFHIENTQLLANNKIYIIGFGGLYKNRGSAHLSYGFNWQGNRINPYIGNISQAFHFVKNPSTSATEIWTTGIDTVFCTDCSTGIFGQWSIAKHNLLDNISYTLQTTNYYNYNQEYQELFNYKYPKCNGFVYTSSGKLITASDSVFCKTPIDNSVFGDFDLKRLTIKSNAIIPFVTDTFLVVSNQEVFKMDTLGNVFPYTTLPFQINKIKQFTDSTYLVTSGRKFFIMSPTLNFTDSLDLNTITDSIHSVRCTNNIFYALISNANNYKILKGNSSTNNTTEWPIDSEGFVPQFFEVNSNGDSTFVFGYETGHPTIHFMYQLYASSDAGFQKSNYDVTLGNLVQFVKPQYSCITEYGSYDYVNYTPIYEVRNNSADTLTELFVNCDYTLQALGPWYCHIGSQTDYVCKSYRLFSKLNVSIAPFSTDTITFPFILAKSVESNLDFCYWLTAPESQVDRNPADNIACDLINVGIQKSEASQGFNIFPNPTSNCFHLEFLESNSNNKKIELYNLVGQLVQQIQSSDASVLLDVTRESKGMFLIKVYYDNGTSVIRKVMVQ